MKRSKPLSRTGPPKRKSRIKPRSDRRQEHMVTERIPTVKSMIAAGGRCELGKAVGVDCPIQGLHERRKSSAGGSRTNPENLLGMCDYHNGLIEDYPAIVRKRWGTKFIVREGDREFERLGVGWWKEHGPTDARR